MALKDLKSDLSKFRKPIEKPLIEQKRVEIPKGPNQTPLSQFVDTTPSAPKSNLTTPKQGVTPNKFDNSPKFMGETTPSQFDNSSNYLGETTPTKMSLKERFLGQTEPNVVQQGDKFKGETETANITQGDRFKGQTTPQDYSNAEKFKGETSPTEFKFVKQFLGETTPVNVSLTSQFLGETTPLNVEQGDKFKGQTDTTLITYNPNLESQGKDPKYVDFFTNDDAFGFSPLQKHKSPSKFRGVDVTQTIFNGNTSLYGLNTPSKYDGNSDIINLNSLYDFSTAVNYGVELQLDNGLGKSYTDSVLKQEYNRFNLKEDSPNNWFIKHPLILTGIQTKKGEPFNYGIGGLSFVRGGAVTSTTRAAFDAARIAQMLLTPRGLIWGLKQIGMQRTNKYGKTWTPINLLANVVSQHLGLKWDRPGVIPVGDESWKYNSNGYLLDIYNVFKLTPNLDVLPLRVDPKGGFDSFYGIGITTTNRYTNTFSNPQKTYGDNKANFFQTYGIFAGNTNPLTGDPLNIYSDDTPINSDEAMNFGVVRQAQENSPIPIDDKFEKRGLYKSDGLIVGQPDIADYQAISYGLIAKKANNPLTRTATDFREMYEGSSEQNILGGSKYDYSKQSRESKYKLPKPLPRNKKTINNLFGSESTKYNEANGNADPINSSLYNNTLKSDFVHLFFAWDTKEGSIDKNKIIQFRGTVSGITETFSPSWNGIKYPGRADKSYMYEEFERTLSFNFKAYALSRSEMKTMWNKLSNLAKLTLPTYGSDTYTGHICYFRLGQLWGTGTNGVPTLITSLTYTIPDELSWDLNQDGELAELPMGLDISVSLTLLPTTNYYTSGNALYSFESIEKFK